MSETVDRPSLKPGSCYVIGSNTINQKGNIVIPRDTFDLYDLFDRDDRIHVSFERESRDLLISNGELEDDRYVSNNSDYEINEHRDIHLPTVFRCGYGQDDPTHREAALAASELDIGEGCWQKGETRFFAFFTGFEEQEGMHEGETQSCYLWTRERLGDAIATHDDVYGTDSLPKFTSPFSI